MQTHTDGRNEPFVRVCPCVVRENDTRMLCEKFVGLRPANGGLRRTTGIVGLLLLVSISGCGDGSPPPPKLVKVAGKVLMDGKPLADARIEFQPENGAPSYAETGKDGSYSLRFHRNLKGAMPGKHKIRITTGRIYADETESDVIIPERVPAQYNHNTTLEREVTTATSNMDFELSSEGELIQPVAN